MGSLNYFEYNGARSLDYGVIISSPVVTDAPRRDAENITIPGRSGTLTLSNNRFDDISVRYECWVHTPEWGREPETVRQIKGWLLSAGTGYHRLSDTYNPDYFRAARFNGPISVAHDAPRVSSFDLEFLAYPFQFSLEGDELREVLSGEAIYNPEAFEARPYIKLYGSGDITLTINEKAWELSGVDGYIEIDSMIQNTFKGLENLNKNKTGEGYPILQPGYNEIYASGNIEQILIKPRWCTL